MKTRLIAAAMMASASFFVGCGETGTKQADDKAAVEMMSVDEMETPTKLAVKIDGMMCPSGCAAAIQKECGKLAGMGESTVNYEEGKGYFTFDASKLTQADVISCIEKTNGGDHYTVTLIEEDTEAETGEPANEETPETESTEDEAHV